MDKQYNGGRSSGVYIATFLCAMAAIVLTITGKLNGFPVYIDVVVWIQMAIILYTVLNKKIPIKLQGFIYVVCLNNAVMLFGLYIMNYYLVFMMLSAMVVLISFYHSKLLIVLGIVLGVTDIILHKDVFRVVNSADNNSYVEFYFCVFMFVGVSVSLYYNTYRDAVAMEQLREAVMSAEASEHAKSDFLANMSHEIRTPMNAIIGMCELALRESDLSMTVREYCSQIQNSGRSLLAIINDILDFSKIESGKMELVEDEFNLASTLNDVVNMTMARLGDKPLELIVQVNPVIPKTLVGDEVRIRQIMLNLLTNAVKYTEEGVITLKVNRTVREYGINLVVSVKDTGIGITKKNLEKLFSSFQQVDTKKNRSVEGTGLGLVITKRLVTQMGGFITVNSEYGEGSEFRFVIPLKVKEDRPFIHVNNAEKITAACYVDTSKYNNIKIKKAYEEFLALIGESIQIKYYMLHRFEDVKKRLDVGTITHCFVAKEEFVEHSEYFTQMADKISIIIVQNRKNAVVVPQNMRCVYKPIYELTLASVFNNENSIINLIEEKIHTNTFIAPKARILLVDDNLINLQVAVGLMQPYKMQILTVTSGKDAIRMLGSRDFDMVFMDHMMPEMDGVEATQLIRAKEDEYYKKLPIVALTANAVSGAREMYLANGFDGFITKPIELSALDRVLKNNLPAEKMEKPEMDVQNKKEEKEIKTDSDTQKLIDTKVGLSYIGNNVDTYMAILSSYVEKGKEKIVQIAQLYENEDFKNYVIEVHALKSSSLSIGAKELSEQAKKLELSGKANDLGYIRNHHQEMIQLYEEVLRVGDKIVSDNKSDEEEKEQIPVTMLQKAQVQELLEKLRNAIESFDSDLVAEISEGMVGACYEDISVGEEVSRINDASSDFDYDKAEELLNDLITKCDR